MKYIQQGLFFFSERRDLRSISLHFSSLENLALFGIWACASCHDRNEFFGPSTKVTFSSI